MQLSDNPEDVCFGRFRLDLRRRRLLHDGEPIELGGRALDILRLLASAEGAVVSKDELMTRLWPGRRVAENNLHVHISALRKTLDERSGGDSYVITVPGRGYRLAHLSGSHRPGQSALPSAQDLPLPGKPSIAVLPVANLGFPSIEPIGGLGNRQIDYLAPYRSKRSERTFLVFADQPGVARYIGRQDGHEASLNPSFVHVAPPLNARFN